MQPLHIFKHHRTDFRNGNTTGNDRRGYRTACRGRGEPADARGASLSGSISQSRLRETHGSCELAADEAIDNRDRNLGNILWDGGSVAWIDHERALGVVTEPDANKLALMMIMSGDPNDVQRSAIAICLSLGEQAVAEAALECGSMPEVASFAASVTVKLPRLAQRVLARFPQPADLLNPT